MMHWSIDVLQDGERAAIFHIPGDVDKAAIMDLMRQLTAKSLTFAEIAGCTWSEHHGRLTLLDVQELDAGRTLQCGHGTIAVHAREIWRA
jgi:hypothetical protein